MTTRDTTSMLPAAFRRPPVPRHVGFLSYNRRALTVIALGASGLLASIPAMPASAEVIHKEVTTATSQTYTAPGARSGVTSTAVIRDAFTVSTFSLVQWPVPSTSTAGDGFGPRSCAGCSAFHNGIDLLPGAGTPIHAIADGVVTDAGNPGTSLGVYVMIEHVIDGQKVTSIYAHMQYGSAPLAVGDTVKRGQQIGLVGNTGLSTGAHLHFGLLVNGIEIDPRAWLQAHANS